MKDVYQASALIAYPKEGCTYHIPRQSLNNSKPILAILDGNLIPKITHFDLTAERFRLRDNSNTYWINENDFKVLSKDCLPPDSDSLSLSQILLWHNKSQFFF